MVHRQATMSRSSGWTSSSAKVAGASPPSVLITATPECVSDPTTCPRIFLPEAVTTSSCDAPATADAAVTMSSPPGSTTPVVRGGPLAFTGSSPTRDGRTEATSCMTSWPTTGMDVSDVVEAEMVLSPAPPSTVDAVVVPLESMKVRTTARVVARPPRRRRPPPVPPPGAGDGGPGRHPG